jgi:MoaA/NifB/PqqE/SkfB family radical SAM enzyme
MEFSPLSLVTRISTRYRQVAAMNPRLKSPRAYTNWILSNVERIAGTSRVRARPLKLTFDPTNVCQLRCPLCPTGLQVQDRPHGHARLEVFQRLLEQVGLTLFFMDFYNWGEPLLNTHVEELIALASARRIICSMSTNLSLPLTDERIERILTSGLNELVVAADGATAKSYSIYRRRGDFELVQDNMRRIVTIRRQLGQTKPLITWQYLVFRFNEDEKDLARRLAAEIGVDRIEFRTPFLDIDRYEMPDSQRREMSSWSAEDRLYQIAPRAAAAADKHHARCGWHYTSAAINWDGSVAPCCTVFEKRDDFGSLGANGEHPYMDVINNPAFRSVRDRFAGRAKEPSGLVCERCPTPLIMDYHKALNRQIVFYSLVALLESVRRIGRARSRRVLPDVLPVRD